MKLFDGRPDNTEGRLDREIRTYEYTTVQLVGRTE